MNLELSKLISSISTEVKNYSSNTGILKHLLTITVFYFPCLKSIYFQINFSISVFGIPSHSSLTKKCLAHVASADCRRLTITEWLQQGLRGLTSWMSTPPLPLTCCAILGKLSNLSVLSLLISKIEITVVFSHRITMRVTGIHA